MSPDRLSTTFAALADPTRRAILARLTSGETTVTELAKPFKMSLPAVSKHLQVLVRAGLIAAGSRCAVAALPAPGGSAQGCRRLARTLSQLMERRLSIDWAITYSNCKQRRS